jgi:hypothetical protein
MTTARQFTTATSLPSGKVLITGGSTLAEVLASAELYDLTAGTFIANGSMAVARDGHTATLLPGGMVLIAGGEHFGDSLASAELYE